MPVTNLTGTTWVFNNTFPRTFPKKDRYYTEGDIRGLTPTSDYGYFIDFIWKDGSGEYNCNYIYNYDYDAGTTIGVATYPNGTEHYFDGTMTITGGTDATNADLISWLEANATLQTPTTPRKSVDLTTLAGWEALSSGSHNITIVAKANGFKDSTPSAAVQVEKAAAMPNKGDIITMDSKQYRVLKLNGTVAEVLCMYDANSSIKFDSASSGYNNTYAGKNIDTYCNNTFYNGLSAAMKSSIVDKTFTQDSWKQDSSAPTESHYTGKYGSTTYYLKLANAAYGSSITRHCYCLSVQDVLDYLEATTSMGTSDTTLTDTNVWKMFWNVTTSQNGKPIWLRSASTSSSSSVFYVDSRGYLFVVGIDRTYAARPAFQIDLSKISWSK